MQSLLTEFLHYNTSTPHTPCCSIVLCSPLGKHTVLLVPYLLPFHFHHFLQDAAKEAELMCFHLGYHTEKS